MDSSNWKIRELSNIDKAIYQSFWQVALTQQADYFRTSIKDPSSTYLPEPQLGCFTLGAFINQRLIGSVTLTQLEPIKLRHKALLSRMVMCPTAKGKGIASQLLCETLKKALNMAGLNQIHLTVLASNQRAQALYNSQGFIQYACEPQSVLINGEYVDEWQMALILRS